jgi:hypothetical protein
MNAKSMVVVAALLATVILVYHPSAYAWSSSPQITNSLDGSGNTVLTIQFDFSQMSDPPTASHHPTDFQVRTSTDGSSWTEQAVVHIPSIPATTVFTVTYSLGKVTGDLQAQARLNCNVHGWSSWGPDPAVPVPEFPFGMVTVTSLLLLVGSLLLVRRKSPAYSS